MQCCSSLIIRAFDECLESRVGALHILPLSLYAQHGIRYHGSGKIPSVEVNGAAR